MLRFRNDLDKWAFLESAPFADAREPRVLATARALRAVSRDARTFAHLAHALARDGIRYITDTERVGREHISEAGHVYADYMRGADDCDAKARLFCALCLAAELDARMVPRWQRGGREPAGDDDVLQHVSAAVRLPEGRWVDAELTLARARLGEIAEDVPFEKDGKWLRT